MFGGGLGFRVWGLGFRGGLGFGVWGLGFRVWGWFRVQGLGFGSLALGSSLFEALGF